MPLVTWYSPTPAYRVTPAANEENDILDALNSLIVASSSSASAYWEVVEYVNVSPRSLMLRRKNNAAGRILIFGQNGSTPNAAAVRGTAAASTLYIAYSASSTATNVSSYLTGAPLAASDYIPGVVWGPFTASQEYLLSYVEHTDGVFFGASIANNSFFMCGAGEILEDISGTAISAIQGTGTTGASPWTTSGSSNAMIPGTPAADSSYTSSQAAIVARISGANKLLFRIFTFQAPANQCHDLASHRAEYHPIWLCYNTTDSTAVFGKMRQVAFGPPSNRWTARVGGGSPPNQADAYAMGHQHFDLISGTPIWFTNFAV